MDNQAFQILLDNLRDIKTSQCDLSNKLDSYSQKTVLIENKIDNSIMVPKLFGKIILGIGGAIASVITFIKN